MTKELQTKTSKLYELEQWQDIIHSSEWRVFKKLLEEHKIYLQQEVNTFLRNHEDRKASETLRAMDDCSKILTIITNRIALLRTQTEEDKK